MIPWLRPAVSGIALLIALELMWELWLAPTRALGPWLALKVVPLALLWPGLARGVRRPAQWLALLLPIYIADGLVRALSDPGRSRVTAATVTLVAVLTFVALLASLRRRPP